MDASVGQGSRSLWRREPELQADLGSLGVSPIVADEHAREFLESRGCLPPRVLVGRWAMEVVYERCAGLDVHKRTVTACIITPEERKTRTFGAMTKDLLGLVDW